MTWPTCAGAFAGAALRAVQVLFLEQTVPFTYRRHTVVLPVGIELLMGDLTFKQQVTPQFGSHMVAGLAMHLHLSTCNYSICSWEQHLLLSPHSADPSRLSLLALERPCNVFAGLHLFAMCPLTVHLAPACSLC